MRDIIVIAGCAATGKRTVGSALAKALGVPFLDYSEFLLRAGAAWLEGEEVVIDKRKAREAFKGLMGPAVVSGIYAADFIERRRIRLIAVLRVHPRVLFYRYIIRGYGLRKAIDNVMSEYLDVCLSMALKRARERVVQINATFCTPEQVAMRIMRALQGQRVFDPVSWLSEVRGPGDLRAMRLHG